MFAGFVKQVVLFAVQKASCRLLRIGAISSQFRLAKEYPGKLDT